MFAIVNANSGMAASSVDSSCHSPEFQTLLGTVAMKARGQAVLEIDDKYQARVGLAEPIHAGTDNSFNVPAIDSSLEPRRAIQL